MQEDFDKIKSEYDKKVQELETVKEKPQKKRLKIIMYIPNLISKVNLILIYLTKDITI